MTSSTLTRTDATSAGPQTSDADGCARVALDLCDPGTALDALAKVVTMLRGRRWDVRGVDADLDAGVVWLTVRTDRVELLVLQLERVVPLGSVRIG